MLLVISAEKIWDEAVKLVVSYGPKLLLAIFVLFAGFWIIKKISKLIAKLMEKRNVD
ncbi:MAG: hypothetical protein II165_08880, partial [Bacteroidales bacterium]|nr:hypothetical protein [Bacteroidales bacterium]